MDETGASNLWRTCEDAGNQAYAEGRYAEAALQFRSALTAAEGCSPEDPRLAASLNNLGQVYRAQGRYAEAEPLLRLALDQREQTLDPHDHDLAQSLNDLAALYSAQGRFAEAVPL